ncbi:uncharacterized protein LOC128397666 [Panonychus citri]|uniref:uncharacterized protein LOC128397666 n=1 Tax=Panonychus citri TaxID=50023 RepID=UPI0023082069|nr:uncharacterized protein LOC128397666 [Panonychus citri]
MSLNDLPDICLWKIFKNVNEAEDLIRLSKVCSRWSDLITLRFRRVKYLQKMEIYSREVKADYIDTNSLWINRNTNWSYYNLLQFFPNFKIIDTATYSYNSSLNLPEIVKNNPQIKGLIGYFNSLIKREDYDLSNIEMFASEFNFDYKKVFRPDQLKQVFGSFINKIDLPSFIEYFPNLKRLHMQFYRKDQVFYNGPNLSALKILEFGRIDMVGKFTGFHFIDFCPSLESAFIGYWAEDIYVKESIKNYNLRDLVIENIRFGCFLWLPLKKLVSKFPNLQHLAIRKFDKLDVSHFDLEELIQLIPKLKILDLRGCKKVTHKSADFLSKYCAKKNRSIVIYYDCENETHRWPKLVNTINELAMDLIS